MSVKSHDAHPTLPTNVHLLSAHHGYTCSRGPCPLLADGTFFIVLEKSRVGTTNWESAVKGRVHD
jgi:hypothetical protein